MDCASKFESIEIQNPKKSPSTTWTCVDKRYSTWRANIFEVIYGLFVHFLVGQLHIEPRFLDFECVNGSCRSDSLVWRFFWWVPFWNARCEAYGVLSGACAGGGNAGCGIHVHSYNAKSAWAAEIADERWKLGLDVPAAPSQNVSLSIAPKGYACFVVFLDTRISFRPL
jgi:hypothetical protein